ncbi:hypothetical protein FKM82_012346 [Ascaphus truei]
MHKESQDSRRLCLGAPMMRSPALTSLHHRYLPASAATIEPGPRMFQDPATSYPAAPVPGPAVGADTSPPPCVVSFLLLTLALSAFTCHPTPFGPYSSTLSSRSSPPVPASRSTNPDDHHAGPAVHPAA